MSRGAHAPDSKGAGPGGRRFRRLRSPVVVFLCAFALASGTAAFAYTTTSGSGTGTARAVALTSPGPGAASAPTATSLSLSWGASPGLPSGGGYLVLRSTSPGGPFEKDSSGTCQQSITIVSAATSCTDTGLAAGTAYYYEVEAAYYDISTLWVSPSDGQFSGSTAPAAVPPGTVPQPPVVTSADTASLLVGAPGTFQVTASGTPAPTYSDTAFSGCTPSTLPSGVSFSEQGLLSGTPGTDAVGTYTVCVNATNGVLPNATETLTLSIDTEVLSITSAALSGTVSGTPNLGPITVARVTGAGTPITTGGALTVNLASAPSSGATFAATLFASSAVTSVTIPGGQSSVTFWYGSTVAGHPTITVSAAGYGPASQVETVTTTPAQPATTTATQPATTTGTQPATTTGTQPATTTGTQPATTTGTQPG